ncbi:hypothetical protein GC167_09955 [bacterium]|nr:hypothetical protein [bacterium]
MSCLLALGLQAQNFDFALGFGGTNDDFGQSISLNEFNQVYVSGAFQGNVDFDPGPGLSIQSAQSNSRDVYLSRFDPDGTHRWTRRIGGSNLDRAYKVVAQGDGVYVTGVFSGTVDFDPLSTTFQLSSSGQTDVFVAKYDTTGALVWARKIGGIGIEYAYNMAVDTLDQVYVAGSFQGTVDFNPGSGTLNRTASGTSDAFVLKLSSSGTLAFASTWGGSGASTIALTVGVDAQQNPLVVGYFAGTVDFNPGSGTQWLSSAGQTDAFCVKLSASGSHLWSIKVGGVRL